MLQRSILLLITFFVLIFQGNAQDVKCGIEIAVPKLQINDPQVFEVLKTSIFEMMNGRKWTNDIYKEEEKIELNILINITEEVSASYFKAKITVKSARPVHNSNYNTVLFNHIDNDIEFSYEQYQPLIYTDEAFVSNLTSILAFYTYIALGLDYDSFSPNGGTVYFQKAQNIVNNAQNRPESGWKAIDGNSNRYWMAENFVNTKYDQFRNAIYKYHRQGMDVMYKDPNKARKTILESLRQMDEINRNFRNTVILRTFFNAKSEELVGIFSSAPQEEKDEAVEILQRVDPTRSNQYKKILKK